MVTIMSRGNLRKGWIYKRRTWELLRENLPIRFGLMLNITVKNFSVMSGLFSSHCVLSLVANHNRYNTVSPKKHLLPHVNFKGADQNAHMCSLISTFIVHLDSI